MLKTSVKTMQLLLITAQGCCLRFSGPVQKRGLGKRELGDGKHAAHLDFGVVSARLGVE